MCIRIHINFPTKKSSFELNLRAIRTEQGSTQSSSHYDGLFAREIAVHFRGLLPYILQPYRHKLLAQINDLEITKIFKHKQNPEKFYSLRRRSSALALGDALSFPWLYFVWEELGLEPERLYDDYTRYATRSCCRGVCQAKRYAKFFPRQYFGYILSWVGCYFPSVPRPQKVLLSDWCAACAR